MARCDARNFASARLMERLGMRKEAHFRQHALVKGHWDEELIYAILADEWQGACGPVENRGVGHKSAAPESKIFQSQSRNLP
jgi:hypothetical protein